jgi:hypothetical protein
MSDAEFQAEMDATREAVRTRIGSRRKALAIEARAPTRLAKRGKLKRRSYLEKRLSQISAVCRYDDGVEIPSELKATEIDAAIATITEAIGELNKLIGRLEEARPQK